MIGFGGNGKKKPEQQQHSASDDMIEQEKLGLIYIYNQGGENRFEMSIPVNDPMGKIFAINLLNNVIKAVIDAPIKKFKPKILQPPANFINRLRQFKSKRK
jgi:hypothetical protein